MNAPAELKQSPYERLASINVNAHTEKKANLTYLSWAWAVDQLLRADPNAVWAYGEPVKFGETMMVFCEVTAFGKRMTAQLPVMDHRNKAIANPDAFQVNTAMQRCLAKAIALHGLGLYIYAGEDLPEGYEKDEPKKATPAPVKAALQGVVIPDTKQTELKVLAMDLVHYVENCNDPTTAANLFADFGLDADEKLYLWDVLQPNSKTRSAIKKELASRQSLAGAM
jgi:uncharacterized protein (DUF427 family)